MRLLSTLVLLCLLLHSSVAKKKQEKKEGGYWEHLASEVYEHASEASQKLSKASADALKRVNEVVDTDKVALYASDAYATAATAAGQLGKKAVEVSSAAYESVNAVVESGEASRTASDVFNSAAAAAKQIGQNAAEVSSAAYAHVNAALEERDWKTRASDAARDAAAAASSAAVTLARGLSEAAKGRSEDETWSAYISRVAPALAYGEGTQAEGKAETDNAEAAGAKDGEEIKDQRSVEKKHHSLEEYFLFWRALNGSSWRESLTEFAQRFYYENDENEKRAVNNGYAAAINTLAGSFKQINQYGRGAIYSLSDGFGWGMRQINTARPKAIFKPSLFGSAFSQAGSLFWYGSVAAEGINVANAAVKDLDEGTSINTVRASSKAVASWTGAAVGASAGATLLSVVPVIGPLVGGIAGGIAGAYSGEIAGEAGANAYVQAFSKEHNITDPQN
ncbi:hypothetical protein PMAYCL1PPCAC_27852 [Pristionchus mayeri]|uniref:Uncharacterized protein n=1 Tax=Pristionchus mayeri TaxID=1317129 RepID=A0AAN5I9H0_9BILA|nr:hypothetical protein PMAYCL1PPCAC_27852 [Pristionchus mayeri]